MDTRDKGSTTKVRNCDRSYRQKNRISVIGGGLVRNSLLRKLLYTNILRGGALIFGHFLTQFDFELTFCLFLVFCQRGQYRCFYCCAKIKVKILLFKIFSWFITIDKLVTNSNLIVFLTPSLYKFSTFSLCIKIRQLC